MIWLTVCTYCQYTDLKKPLTATYTSEAILHCPSKAMQSSHGKVSTLVPNTILTHFVYFVSVIIKWSKPQLASELDGRATLQRKPSGIRETGESVCRTVVYWLAGAWWALQHQWCQDLPAYPWPLPPCTFIGTFCVNYKKENHKYTIK